MGSGVRRSLLPGVARVRRRLASVFAGCWLLSLWLPAMTIFFEAVRPRQEAGWQMLVFGWIAAVGLQFGWYANPVLAVFVLPSWLWPKSTRWLKACGVLLLLTTANTAALFIWPTFNKFGSAQVGYWLWVANNLAAAGASLVFSRKRFAFDDDTI